MSTTTRCPSCGSNHGGSDHVRRAVSGFLTVDQLDQLEAVACDQLATVPRPGLVESLCGSCLVSIMAAAV